MIALIAPSQIIMGPTGEVMHFTGSSEAWLEPPQRVVLARLVRGMHAEGVMRSQHVVAGQRLAIARLLGGHPAYLLTIQPSSTLDPFADLTPRQREIAMIASAGATAAEIGGAIGLSTSTVRVHLRDIYARLAIGTRVELANIAHSRSAPGRRRRALEGNAER